MKARSTATLSESEAEGPCNANLGQLGRYIGMHAFNDERSSRRRCFRLFHMLSTFKMPLFHTISPSCLLYTTYTPYTFALPIHPIHPYTRCIATYTPTTHGHAPSVYYTPIHHTLYTPIHYTPIQPSLCLLAARRARTRRRARSARLHGAALEVSDPSKIKNK